MLNKIMNLFTKRDKIEKLNSKIKELNENILELSCAKEEYANSYKELIDEYDDCTTMNNLLKKKVDSLLEVNESYIKTFSNQIEYDNEKVIIKDNNKSLNKYEKTILHFETIWKRLKGIQDQLNSEQYEILCEYGYTLDRLRDGTCEEYDTLKPGYVYIISNKALRSDLYKIGYTENINVEQRIKTLNNASIPFPYEIHAVIYCPNAYATEQYIHGMLQDYNVNKEFFQMDFEEIIRRIKRDMPWLVISNKDFTKLY